MQVEAYYEVVCFCDFYGQIRQVEMTGGVQRFARLAEHKPIGRITVWKFKRGEGKASVIQ